MRPLRNKHRRMFWERRGARKLQSEFNQGDGIKYPNHCYHKYEFKDWITMFRRSNRSTHDRYMIDIEIDHMVNRYEYGVHHYDNLSTYGNGIQDLIKCAEVFGQNDHGNEIAGYNIYDFENKISESLIEDIKTYYIDQLPYGYERKQQ